MLLPSQRLGFGILFYRDFNQSEWLTRKPSSEAATYLIDKYQLNPDNTYYIGDRTLDVEFAQNSGIQSLNFLESTYEGNHRIQALADIPVFLRLSNKRIVSVL